MDANAKESVRVFFALWPDDATRAALLALQASMRGRVIPYDNLHMTLAFLGQQPVSLLPVLKDILTHLPPLASKLVLDRLGYFTRKKIAWIGSHKVPDALPDLQRELVQAIVQSGIDYRIEQSFKAHITLARDAELPPDITFTPVEWHASQIALVQSSTQARGAVYQVVASRSLDRHCWIPSENGEAAGLLPE